MFCKFIILHDFVRYCALKKCDPYVATPVRIKVNGTYLMQKRVYFMLQPATVLPPIILQTLTLNLQ